MDQRTNQSSSIAIWYVIGAVVIIAFAFWYFYGKQTSTTDTQSTVVEQTQTPAQSSGNTTADISADLNQVTDASVGLDADASATGGDINSL